MHDRQAAVLTTGTAFLSGGGEMGQRIREFDWTGTPLGPPATWPLSLKTAVRIMLTSRQAMWIGWGPQLTSLYNDPYKSIIGGKDPAALGRPTSIVWREIWKDISPVLDSVMNDNEGTYVESQRLIMERSGYREETYYTFSYSPIPDDRGTGGVFCANTDDTEQVLRERQLGLLRRLAGVTANARTVARATELIAEALATDRYDLPFALLYLVDDGDLVLGAASGLEPGHTLAPHSIAANAEAPWPVGEALRAHRATPARVDEGVASGVWDERATQAVVLPITAYGSDDHSGVLVAGLNPFRLLDDSYRGFLEDVASQIAAVLASALAYEQERARAEALSEIDRAKTIFFSNISHEFRTPLTLMLGPTEDALASPARALTGDNLDTLYRNELRLLKLVNALLDFSRIEAGRVQASFERVDLCRLTSDLASVFRAAIERAGLTLVIDCGEITAPVYVDRQMWETILFNLLSNSLKFTFEGRIEVTVRQHADEIELRVHDTGIGIPAAEMPRLFERFHRIEGARARTQEGSGIGLALVRDLVGLHGGSVHAESSHGAGTTFFVRLRTGTAHLPADKLTTAATATDITPRRGAAFVEEALKWLPADTQAAPTDGVAAGRVLVADDNADMREYVTRLLGDRWQVDAVGDGTTALSRAQSLLPDVIVTDVMMPGLDGFQLLHALRADPRTARIPVIMLSARAGEEARVEGLQHGADDYLVKPFSARELIARVNTQITLSRHERERAELLQREQAARRDAEMQKQYLFSVFMQAPMPIVVLRGPDFVIELANPQTCEVWAKRHDEVIDRPLFDALPEIRTQVFRDLLDRVYQTGTPYVGHEVPAMLGDDKRTVYFTFVYTPYRNAQGAIDGVLVVASDVTAQVAARQTLQHAHAEAHRANQAKDEFLAMLGHELRNPLAPIQTALQVMRLRGDDSAEAERAIIQRQVSHLTRLVDDLLDVSRITRGKVELKRAPVELSEIVVKAIETSSPLLEQREHRLEIDVPRHGLVVDADQVRLAQVIANLVNNAAKYTPPGGHIEVAARRDGPDVVLTVRDNGIGIGPELLPDVFDLFVQGRQMLDRSHGGLGLGLAIVRSLVERHDGTVSARSAGEGGGAEFQVRLPAAEAAAASAPTTSRASTRAANGIRVLIVDDNEDAAQMLVYALEMQGYASQAAHDGPSAIELAATFKPHVALLDIGLPVMDGYELAGRLREVNGLESLRTVAITGYGQERDRERSRAAGIDRHLVKPIDVALLDQVIDELSAG